MTRFRVFLQRRLAQEAAIEVEAESDDEARDLAKQRADDGMVHWFDVHKETNVEVEGP